MMQKHEITTDHPLKSSGRFGRLAFTAWSFLSSLVLLGVVFVLVLLFAAIFGFDDTQDPTQAIFSFILGGVYVIAYVVFLLYSFIFSIRRLHDCNRSGWFSVLMIIPLLNLFLMIYLFAARGTEGPNDYGLPWITKGWEKVLGWVYLVLIPLVFVGILIGVALPAYQEYTQRAQYADIQLPPSLEQPHQQAQ